MDLQEVKKLLRLIAAGDYTRQQEADLSQWLDHAGKAEYLDVLSAWEEILDAQPNHGLSSPELISRIEAGLNNIDKPTVPLYAKKERRTFGLNIAVAASLLAMLSVALFFYTGKDKKSIQQVVKHITKEIGPGGNKAILTLADGSKIDLNDIADGEIASQAGIKIVKDTSGQLVYTIMNAAAANSTGLYNSIQTPNGGQYRVNLPDGSAVWLNAASSLRYPVVFNGAERRVELTGEAYFEIAKEKNRPFRVITANQTVEVLGTHFNINSYDDEHNTKTSLLEGSVKIQNTFNKKSMVLKPGQQSQVDSYSISVKEVDVNDAAAWKDGFFVFNAESIPSAMRKIARWYDLEIAYEGNIDDKDLAGSVSRFKNVSEVLKTIELTELVHFKVEGRKITVIAN